MRILLLGEYSSYSAYLRDGLIQLGHEVTLASSSDNWKGFHGEDVTLWDVKGKNRFTNIVSIVVSSFMKVHKLYGYDIVHFVNPNIYFYPINYWLVKKIIKNNHLISLAAIGYDSALIKAYKENKFEYYIDDFLHETPWTLPGIVGYAYNISDAMVVSSSKIIIPGLYEYSVGYEGSEKIYNVIPMPVNLEKIQYSDNFVDNKVVFFHGLNRENAKGTKYIREAFEIINKKYPNKVETIIDGHIPFDKYLEVINKTNVMVDQCSCYGYGINALISMAKGKVVMTGAHDKTLEAFGVRREECPIFHTTPNVDQLVNQMSYIIDHKEMIPKWGMESRKYVENIHECKKVAAQYIDAWSGLKNDTLGKNE